MDLSSQYLGLELPHPFMSGASPLVDDLDLVRRLEDSGAAAIVMHSLFEEQLAGEELASYHYLEAHAESFAEAHSYIPCSPDFALGPEEYLDQLRMVKEAVAIPVIGSLNGTTPGGWLEYARLMEQAGADALELDIYQLATDPEENPQILVQRLLDTIRDVSQQTFIPVAVKLSPYYTSLSYLARQLDQLGVSALVLFNRFYQADIDIEELEVSPALQLSDSSELLLRIRWLAILSGRVAASLAVSGGVHTARDAVKAIMSGADGIQLVSALLRHGPEQLRIIREETVRWMEEHEYESIAQMRGSMNLLRCPDPQAFERINYVRVLSSWKGFAGR